MPNSVQNSRIPDAESRMKILPNPEWGKLGNIFICPRCGNVVEMCTRFPLAKWWKSGGNVVEIWWKCGGNVGVEMWWKCCGNLWKCWGNVVEIQEYLGWKCGGNLVEMLENVVARSPSHFHQISTRFPPHFHTQILPDIFPESRIR